MNVKALVIAGGIGSRAKPFTDYSPKSLMPIFDRPLIDYVVRYLGRQRCVGGIVVVTDLSGRGKQIANYFEGKESLLEKRLTFVDDHNDGTAGAVVAAASRLSQDEPFLVWFGDNLCAVNVDDMARFHKEKGGIGCVAVSRRRREETGFVETNEDGLITKFVEKPVTTLAMPECLGIYIFERRLLRHIEEAKKSKRQVNLSLDVLQALPAQEKLYAYDVGERPWIDAESPAKVERHLPLLREIIKSMEGEG